MRYRDYEIGDLPGQLGLILAVLCLIFIGVLLWALLTLGRRPKPGPEQRAAAAARRTSRAKQARLRRRRQALQRRASRRRDGA
ncbi:hypothetical protein RM844_19680 [Streptomyces sp. DSM 44915]|uniref:Uncharacterized protein n=1 Tax=Streptomyces chisholmiae TaxID=3075540 RepID=A0ABU2JU42_9ACTN|nr:hypothetical protein [Streptomyces sp. DSM 44915]MDT0268510.1 hypothetical protein [Streptomyces sp. DSM 44915]